MSAENGTSTDLTARNNASGNAQSMANKRLMLAAVVVGIVFVILLNIQGMIENKRMRDSQVQVVLVTTDLQSGSVLSASNMRPISVPSELVRQAPGLKLFSDIEPGVTQVKRAVVKNDLLRLNDMVDPVSSDDTLSRRLRGDRRVLSLVVDSRQPSAFIRSGSRVDIYGVLQGAGKTVLVIENLEVLSIDGEVDIDGGKRSYRSIETHVPAELVERIKEAQRRCMGPLSLSVRRPGDMTMKYAYDVNRPEQGGTLSSSVQQLLGQPYKNVSRPETGFVAPGVQGIH